MGTEALLAAPDITNEPSMSLFMIPENISCENAMLLLKLLTRAEP